MLAAVGAAAAVVVGTTAFRNLRAAAPFLADVEARLGRAAARAGAPAPPAGRAAAGGGRNVARPIVEPLPPPPRTAVRPQCRPLPAGAARVREHARHPLRAPRHLARADGAAGRGAVVRPEQHDLLWTRGRYRLVRRRDGAVADLRVSLPLGAEPVRVDPDGGALSVATAGIAPTQELAALPHALELWFESAVPGTVSRHARRTARGRRRCPRERTRCGCPCFRPRSARVGRCGHARAREGAADRPRAMTTAATDDEVAVG